ncbi:MAG: hypothetical protein JRE18_12495 [Deltaproteobacteria bacterium]|jgi:hypothetical protein|nr:hypothetical protein [Deltaproteobacteria bacterium]
MSSEKTKRCWQCKEEKTLDNFWKERRRGDGLSPLCKPCQRAKSKKYMSEYGPKYYQKNKDKIHAERKKRRSTHESARIAETIRCRIRNVVTCRYKSKPTLELVGVESWEELAQHLESQFTDGMSWDNYGQWHIDHIRPCVSFDLTDPEQQKECFNYTNLQPLWAKDNLSKGGKWDG